MNNLKRKLILPISAAIVVLAIALSVSAFQRPMKADGYFADQYFQYTGSSYAESDFENAANWTSIGTSNPASNPCISGTAHSCVVKVDQSQLSTNPSLTLPQKMAAFLAGRTDPNGATNYVNSSANYTYQKP